MSETHTEKRGGWFITVWLDSGENWFFRAVKFGVTDSGVITASNRVEAVNNVVEHLKERKIF